MKDSREESVPFRRQFVRSDASPDLELRRRESTTKYFEGQSTVTYH